MADGVATDGVAGGGPTQGWYRDPWDVEPLRWWDGQAWTGHTARPGDDGAPAVHARRGSSARAGDPIRAVEFRETLKGYRKDVVDQLLEQAAAEVDAGRVPTAVVNHAPFPESFTGYHRDDVDDYIRALAASPSSLPGPTSTIPSGRDDPIASPNPSSGSDQRPVRTARSATSPPRSAPKGWTPLKGALSAIFLVGGVIVVVAGAATWHSVASRPHVVAIVASQFHCVTDADTGPACDEHIAFAVGDRQIRTVVRGIDPGRDLVGPPGHQSITVFYDPAAPTHVEGVDGVALNGVALILGGLAAIVGVIVLGALITRNGRKSGRRPAPKSEIHRSIVS